MRQRKQNITDESDKCQSLLSCNSKIFTTKSLTYKHFVNSSINTNYSIENIRVCYNFNDYNKRQKSLYQKTSRNTKKKTNFKQKPLCLETFDIRIEKSDNRMAPFYYRIEMKLLRSRSSSIVTDFTSFLNANNKIPAIAKEVCHSNLIKTLPKFASYFDIRGYMRARIPQIIKKKNNGGIDKSNENISQGVLTTKKCFKSFDFETECNKFIDGEKLKSLFYNENLNVESIKRNNISLALKYKNADFIHFLKLIISDEVIRNKGQKVRYKRNSYYAEKLNCSIRTIIRFKKTLMLFGVSYEETIIKRGVHKGGQNQDRFITKDIELLKLLEQYLLDSNDSKLDFSQDIHNESTTKNKKCHPPIIVPIISTKKSIKQALDPFKKWMKIKDLFQYQANKLIDSAFIYSKGVFNRQQITSLLSCFRKIIDTEGRLFTRIDIFFKRFINYIASKVNAQRSIREKYGTNYEIKEIRITLDDQILTRYGFTDQVKELLLKRIFTASGNKSISSNIIFMSLERVYKSMNNRDKPITTMKHFINSAAKVAIALLNKEQEFQEEYQRGNYGY